MTANVVVFSLQLGAAGFDVARAVATALNYQYYDSEITFDVANQVGASPAEVEQSVERVPGFVQQMLERFALAGGAVGETYAVSTPEPDTLTSALNTLSQDNYRELIDHVIRELAARGECVIVGHAAQLSLAETAGVLKVLVYGSVEKRAERLAADGGVDLRKARAIAEQSDKDRANFFERVHRVDWLSPKLYDLCLSTDDFDTATASGLVTTAAKALPGIIKEGA